MPDQDNFDFDEEELVVAFLLVFDDRTARQLARSVASAWRPGMDWAASEDVLLLLSVASPSSAAKMQRIRAAEQDGRRTTWILDQRASGTADSDQELETRWRSVVRAEDEAWEERRETLRQTLREQGKELPDRF